MTLSCHHWWNLTSSYKFHKHTEVKWCIWKLKQRSGVVTWCPHPSPEWSHLALRRWNCCKVSWRGSGTHRMAGRRPTSPPAGEAARRYCSRVTRAHACRLHFAKPRNFQWTRLPLKGLGSPTNSQGMPDGVPQPHHLDWKGFGYIFWLSHHNSSNRRYICCDVLPNITESQ